MLFMLFRVSISSMRAVILYKFESEDSTEIENFLRELERRYPGQKIEKLNTETREGAEFGKTYDITSYPALAVMKNDGQLVQMWVGMPLPLIDEIASYILEHGA